MLRLSNFTLNFQFFNDLFSSPHTKFEWSPWLHALAAGLDGLRRSLPTELRYSATTRRVRLTEAARGAQSLHSSWPCKVTQAAGCQHKRLFFFPGAVTSMSGTELMAPGPCIPTQDPAPALLNWDQWTAQLHIF